MGHLAVGQRAHGRAVAVLHHQLARPSRGKVEAVGESRARVRIPQVALPNVSEEEEWSCQLDRQLMKHHRGDTPSWGCAPPLIHVPEGMRSCICVEARDLLLCTLSCWPVGSVLLSVIHPHCHKSLSLAVKPLFSQRDLASNRSLWYLRWALVPARTRARYMRPASPGGA